MGSNIEIKMNTDFTVGLMLKSKAGHQCVTDAHGNLVVFELSRLAAMRRTWPDFISEPVMFHDIVAFLFAGSGYAFDQGSLARWNECLDLQADWLKCLPITLPKCSWPDNVPVSPDGEPPSMAFKLRFSPEVESRLRIAMEEIIATGKADQKKMFKRALEVHFEFFAKTLRKTK